MAHARVDHRDDVFPFGARVGAQVDDQFGIITKRIYEFCFELASRQPVTLHPILTRRRNLYDADIVAVDIARVGFATGGKLHVDRLLQQWACDDENNEEHERKVEQRGDVDFVQRHQRIAL